ncbi:hypothetical protein Bpfe_015064 [Biomphalaria pfeifferi]|uniref:Uncharacterized protein n=1 Tax=Biomphalaria pfeifferi TaxID=112525 RepID=A0AAD8BK81_BIOPF|nr:hypothetical protein Bpfe_015064 [Biomphalaria pfeifferi]
MEENRPTECRCRCTPAATRHYKRDLAIAAMNPRTSFNHTFPLGGRMVTPLGARAWIITLLTWILAGDALGRSIGTERYPGKKRFNCYIVSS